MAILNNPPCHSADQGFEACVSSEQGRACVCEPDEGLQRQSGAGGHCNNAECPDFGEFVPTFRYSRNDLWSCDTCGGHDIS